MNRSIIALSLTLLTFLAKADGYVTYLYHIKVVLKDEKIVDGYFIDVDFPQTKQFKDENELKAFLIEKTTGKTGKIEKLYKNLFKILDYPSVESWIRGHIIISKSEQLKIEEKDIVRLHLVSIKQIPSQNIENLTDTEIEYLVNEPIAIESLKLEDALTAVGDAYSSYTLFSYNAEKKLDLKKIAAEIEHEYFTNAKNCDYMEKFSVWENVFKKYKEQLKSKDILFLEIVDF